MSFEPSPNQFKSASTLKLMGATMSVAVHGLPGGVAVYEPKFDQTTGENAELGVASETERAIAVANQRAKMTPKADKKYDLLKQFAPSNSRAPKLQKNGMDRRNALLLRQTGRRAPDFYNRLKMQPLQPQPAKKLEVKPQISVAPKMVMPMSDLRNDRKHRAELRLVEAPKPALGLNPISDLVVAMRPTPNAQRRKLMQHAPA